MDAPVRWIAAVPVLEQPGSPNHQAIGLACLTLATHRRGAWRPGPFAGGRGDLAQIVLQPPSRE